MGKGMLRAVLLACGLLTAGVAQAGVTSSLVKADTLYLNSADSTGVIDVSNCARLWLNFIVVPVTGSSGADTTLSLLVQAREVLSIAAGTNATTGNQRAYTAAAYSDTTVIPFVWKYANTYLTGVSSDTLVVGSAIGTNLIPGATECRVNIRTVPNAAGWATKRGMRVDLINVSTGAPFRAQFMSFRWRLVNGPAIAKIRVVLGRETW